MTPLARVWDKTATSPELAGSGVKTAILPIGAIEQHGRSLPLGTDLIEAEAVARGIADRLGSVYLLPGLPFSCSQIHAGYRGSISLSAATLDAVVKEVVGELFGQGFTRVLLLNFHGGNFVLRTTVRELNHTSRSAKVVMIWPWLLPAAIAMIETAGEIHAGELEASLILAIDPALVRSPTAADDAMPDATHEDLDYRLLREISPSGVWGRPSLGTAEKGRRALAAMADAAAAHAVRMFEILGV